MQDLQVRPRGAVPPPHPHAELAVVVADGEDRVAVAADADRPVGGERVRGDADGVEQAHRPGRRRGHAGSRRRDEVHEAAHRW